jgi:hypothetical protein
MLQHKAAAVSPGVKRRATNCPPVPESSSESHTTSLIQDEDWIGPKPIYFTLIGVIMNAMEEF